MTVRTRTPVHPRSPIEAWKEIRVAIVERAIDPPLLGYPLPSAFLSAGDGALINLAWWQVENQEFQARVLAAAKTSTLTHPHELGV